MREEEFRRRLRDALGEPPPLMPPVMRSPATAPPRLYPRLMGALAVGVAILLIVVLVGSRIALQPRGYVVPARSAPPSAVAQLPPDSMPCQYWLVSDLRITATRRLFPGGGLPSCLARSTPWTVDASAASLL